MKKQKSTVEAAGEALIDHARDTEFSAQRGLVGALFPYVVQASKRMSARAISGFLEEKHGIKVSYVTLGKALRQPHKYWNIYYDSIEPYAWIVAETHSKPLRDFICDPGKYQEVLEGKPVYISEDGSEDGALDAKAGYEYAIKILDEKWFCFDEGVLEDALPYLWARLAEKSSQIDPD